MPHLLFPTAFGVCGIAWNEAGITGFQLPERTEAQTDRALERKGGARGVAQLAPEGVRTVVALVQRHLGGDLQDLSIAEIDWTRVSDFQGAVYRHTQGVRPGFKTTYGEIAQAVSAGPEGARAVGAALGANPWPLLVPCHRVVSAGDKMTGFSGPGGIRTKTRLLVLEGAELLSE